MPDPYIFELDDNAVIKGKVMHSFTSNGGPYAQTREVFDLLRHAKVNDKGSSLGTLIEGTQAEVLIPGKDWMKGKIILKLHFEFEPSEDAKKS